MKRIIVILLLLLPLSVMAQKPFKGFFKPVPDNLFKDRAVGTSVWYFRPTITTAAMKFTYVHQEGKPFEISAFKYSGFGISYQHFINNEGTSYNNYGFSGVFLFKSTDESPAAYSLAGTVNLLQYINVGAGYDFTNKKVFLLTGVTYSFN